MRGFVLIILLMMSIVTVAQTDYDTSTDKENGSVVFKGQFTFNELKKEKSFTWLEKGINEYKPDAATIAFLQQQLPQYSIVSVMGTWCEDSQNLVPKLLKVLGTINYPMHQYTMYGVDRTKTTKYSEATFYNITRVPTFIVIKDNAEVGRITETVSKSIEADLQQIIEKDIKQHK